MNIRPRNRTASEVNASAMNDIMFFLLLFFLITSTLVNPNVIKLMLPKATNKEVVNKNITVNIDARENYYINKTPTDKANLASGMQLALMNLKEPVIVINADRTVPIDDVVQVMVIGKKLNAKVILATQPQ